MVLKFEYTFNRGSITGLIQRF